MAATVAAVVMTVLVANVVLPGRHSGPGLLRPQVASAAQVRTRVTAALANTRTLRADLTVECAESVGECAAPESGQRRTVLRWSVVATAAGDERITALSGISGDTAYQADQLTERFSPIPAQGLQAIEVAGYSAGPPDVTHRSPLIREYGSLVRAFLASSAAAPVIDTAVDGRRAWQISVPGPNGVAGPGLDGSGNVLKVVVDQASGFPLRVTDTFHGRFLYESRLSNLILDAPVDPSTFDLRLPAGAPVPRYDNGFKKVSLDQAAAAVGYQPVLPADIPAGYHLAEIAVATHAQATGSEGSNPPSLNVLSLAYRRGFDRIVLTTRSTGTDRAAWSDPFSGEGYVDHPERFTVAQGALAGATANLVLSPKGSPHTWAVDNRLVVTISGDASGDELTRMLASLR